MHFHSLFIEYILCANFCSHTENVHLAVHLQRESWKEVHELSCLCNSSSTWQGLSSLGRQSNNGYKSEKSQLKAMWSTPESQGASQWTSTLHHVWMDRRPGRRANAGEHLEENLGRSLYDLWLGKRFLYQHWEQKIK